MPYSRPLVTIPAGTSIGETTMGIPSELANRITRFDVEGLASAATTILADDQWQRRPVGIAGIEPVIALATGNIGLKIFEVISRRRQRGS